MGLPRIAALWVEGPLGWLQQGCLRSWLAQGHEVTLYHYAVVEGVPEGVTLRDGREVWAVEDWPRHPRRNHYGLFADLFRPRLLAQEAGVIWLDCDVALLAPLQPKDGWLLSRERAGKGRMGTAVVALPQGPLLQAWLDRVTAVPDPKSLPWGALGGELLAELVAEKGAEAHLSPSVRFYPVGFRDAARLAEDQPVTALPKGAEAVHLWASKWGEVPPRDSQIARILGGSGKAAEGQVTSVLDIGGQGVEMVVALWKRRDLTVDLVDLSPEGQIMSDPSPDLLKAQQALLKAGLPPAALRLLASRDDLRKVDLALCLGGKRLEAMPVESLGPILDQALNADSRLIVDLPKAAKGWPFLRSRGEAVEIARPAPAVQRVSLTPFPPAPEPEEDWHAIATALAGREGFFREGAGHSFLYVPRSEEVLVVTFDNLDIAMTKREDRRPWGFEFIEKQGWSMLGVMAGGWTWYREPWVWQEFDRLREVGFFKRFKRVVFYGASMGGYAAAAFSAACPGADVLAISPQSTLDKQVVPWESRYKTAWDKDYSGPYGDAAKVSQSAARVTLLYDPYEPLDAAHVARFKGANVVALRAPLLGHRLGSSLAQMGILTPIILEALRGKLSEASFYHRLRARRDFPRYQRELFERALAKGHRKLAMKMARSVLARSDDRRLRMSLQAEERKL